MKEGRRKKKAEREAGRGRGHFSKMFAGVVLVVFFLLLLLSPWGVVVFLRLRSLLPLLRFSVSE